VRKARGWIAGPVIDFNYDALKHWLLLREKRHALISYERLAERTESVIANLMVDLGLVFEYQQLEWQSEVKHNLSGNEMRRRDSGKGIALDASYQRELGASQQKLVDFFTLPGRFFNRLDSKSQL
jgi:hypothetical protein